MDELNKLAKSLYLGVVYDAMRFDIQYDKPFLLRKEIKPLWRFQEVLFGPAFTCKGEKVFETSHIDDTVRIKMFNAFYKGCVQVISSGGYDQVAQFGDISGKIARKFGALGAVLDAPSRDIKLLEEDQFPIFGDGVIPIDAYSRWQITEYEVPIFFRGFEGDVLIAPGDFIFGDPDGVLVLPQKIASKVLSLAKERLEKEDRVRHEILHTEDIQTMYDRIGRW